MNYKRQAAVTQPVRELRREGIELLIHTDTDEEVLERIGHLAPVLEFAGSAEYRRVLEGPVKLLILSGDEGTARQAALAFMSLHQRRKKVSEGTEEMETDEEKRRFEALFAPFSEMASEISGEDSESDPFASADWEKDFLILTPEKLGQYCGDLQMQQMTMYVDVQKNLQKSMQLPEPARITNVARNVYIDCFRELVTDQTVDAIADLQKEVKVIAMPDNANLRYYLKRLSFEERFQIIRIQKPGEAYYTELMKAYMEASDVAAAEDTELSAVIRKLMIYRGALFQERDIFRLVDTAIQRAGEARLTAGDFRLYGEEEKEEGLEKLERLVGLENVKKAIKGIIAMQKMRLDYPGEGMVFHKNLAFVGPPGTGKTVVAGLYGEIMAELGISNGKFVSAGRADMIGQYLGQTAVKMADLFRRAYGGVLFVDEAGSLTTKDDYTKECITEFVRYMEEQPQTTVIFATYPSEIDALLKSDPGFSSRIRKIVRFESYSEGELYRIFRLMAEENGFLLAEDVEKSVYAYIRECRLAKGEFFGNAREMRRLLEAAAEQYSIRCLAGNTDVREITADDLREAREELISGKMTKQLIGFKAQV